MNAIYPIMFLINRAVLIVDVYISTSRGFFQQKSPVDFMVILLTAQSICPSAGFGLGCYLAVHNLSPAQSKL